MRRLFTLPPANRRAELRSQESVGSDSSDSSTPSISPTRQTSSRSSSISTQTPAEDGKTTWSPGWTGMSTPADSHQSSPGPTASTMPCWGGGSSIPCGTTRPDRRIRSWSSSLRTTWSNRGRSWCLTVSTGSRDDRVLMARRIGRELSGLLAERRVLEHRLVLAGRVCDQHRALALLDRLLGDHALLDV